MKAVRIHKYGGAEVLVHEEIPRPRPGEGEVFDTIGGETQERSWQLLNPGGIMVSIVKPPDGEKAMALGVRQAFVLIGPDARVLAKMAELVDAGKPRVRLHAVFPLAEARSAQVLSQGGHARGKIVLKVG